MPKGVRTNQSDDTPATVRVVLRRAEFDQLAALAEQEYRTVELQVGWMIKQMLKELAARGVNLNGHGAAPARTAVSARAVLDYAAQKHTGPVAEE